jgi:two-component SAPR family response regulator
MTASRLPLDGLRLLIVEDQYMVAADMKRIVERLGGEVVGPLPNHRIATAVLATEPVDLAILDINIDGQMTYEVAELLTARNVPFIFATGYDSCAIDPRFADAPHLEKPVADSALVDAVGRIDRFRRPAA